MNLDITVCGADPLVCSVCSTIKTLYLTSIGTSVRSIVPKADLDAAWTMGSPIINPECSSTQHYSNYGYTTSALTTTFPNNVVYPNAVSGMMVDLTTFTGTTDVFLKGSTT